jgi:hypothetical protein
MRCLLDGFEDLLHNFRVQDLPLWNGPVARSPPAA